ncbi:lipopolysaccharide biosynthesis protein [Thermococcus sp. AM4]|uniref:lipopolysaccharide biosynthesis protein n=1 Tax=Thermococcus sp. (strain AM4) TaxID=246969 RepID=UPI00018712C4|nr:permease [Thermococcus sp. AM4]EEB72933.1 conserved hypothetical protein [Thermococcus sp. AM4]
MELKALLRSTTDLTLGTIVMALSGLFFWLFAARLYPAEEIGTASALVSFMNLVFALSTLGLNIGLVRFYRIHGKGASGTMVTAMLLLSTGLTTAYVLMNPGGAFERPELILGAYLLALFGALYNALGFVSIPLGRTEVYVKMSALYCLRVVFLPFLRTLKAGGMVLATSLGLAVASALGMKEFREQVSFTIDVEFIRESLALSLSNYIGSIVNVLPLYLMPTIVLVELGKEWAGYYYIGFTIGNLLTTPIIALSTVLIRDGKKALFRKSLGLVLSYWALAAAGTFLLGEPILKIFGMDYLNALPMLKAIALGLGPFGLVYLGISGLTLRNAAGRILAINLVRGVSFLLLSYFLLPREGITGIGMAWTLAHLLATPLLDPKTF